MRATRNRRRGFVNLQQVTIGDWIVLFASLMSVISLFLTWYQAETPGARGQWAFTYSEWTSVLVIVIFLITLFLTLYPALSQDFGLPPLPFASPLIFMTLGSLLLLIFTYELGKYGCVDCARVTRGFGVWVGFISAFVYLVGAIVKWGSRLPPYASPR